jgi:uncharacterized protein with gpF-like domain
MDQMPRVPFKDEDRLAQTVRAWHEELFEGLLEAAREAAARFGFRYDAKHGRLVADADVSGVIGLLADLIGVRGADARQMRETLNRRLVGAEGAWLSRAMGLGGRVGATFAAMDLPSALVFRGRIERMRELYLDEAVARVAGEQDDLKAQFLAKMGDWIEGRTEKLDVGGLVAEMQETSARRAKFFARDQYSRMERDLAVASYEEAQADYVEWLTSNDARVRPVPGAKARPGDYHGLPLGNHRARNHRIYTVEALLADPEWKAYNCRCGFVPRYEPLTADQRRRLVA